MTKPDQEGIDLRLANIISDTTDWMFERFDKLHKQDIHDNDVIGYLRREGLPDLAKRYIDWSGAIDPDAEDDNTTMSDVVPDPGDAPSYKTMAEPPVTPGCARFYPEGGGYLDIPDHLIEAFQRGGAE